MSKIYELLKFQRVLNYMELPAYVLFEMSNRLIKDNNQGQLDPFPIKIQGKPG